MFVVGGNEHRIVESLSLDNWQWNILDPYPNVTSIHSVKIVSHNRSFYVFAGVNGTEVINNIVRFKNDTWSRVGSLKSKRMKFSVFFNFDKFHIIGGQKKHKNELCLLSNTVSCAQEFSIDMPGLEEPVLFGINNNGSCDPNLPNYESKETKELMILSNAKFNEIDRFVPVQKTNFRNDKYTFSSRYIDKLISGLIRVYSYCKIVPSVDGRQ